MIDKLCVFPLGPHEISVLVERTLRHLRVIIQQRGHSSRMRVCIVHNFYGAMSFCFSAKKHQTRNQNFFRKIKNLESDLPFRNEKTFGKESPD